MKSKGDSKGRGKRHVKRGAVGLKAKWGEDGGVGGTVNLNQVGRLVDGDTPESSVVSHIDGQDFNVFRGPYHVAWQTMAPEKGQHASAAPPRPAPAVDRDETRRGETRRGERSFGARVEGAAVVGPRGVRS